MHGYFLNPVLILFMRDVYVSRKLPESPSNDRFQSPEAEAELKSGSFNLTNLFVG